MVFQEKKSIVLCPVNGNAEKWRMSAYDNRLYEAMYLKVLYVFSRISRPQ